MLIRSSFIRSFRSNQTSDCERFAQIAQDKCVTVSESLRSLRGNEQMSDSLKKIWLKKSKILFLVCFVYDLKKNFIEKMS